MREKYGTLYIPISEKHLEQFETLKELILRKIEAVKKQDYLEARKIKDEEERIKSNFPKSFIDNFIEINNNFKITSETRDKIKKLDSEILKFKEDLPKLRENIEKENILVITDDLNLSFGSIRIKAKGSDGGHNGLKNIQLLLNTTEYPRSRFGISDQFKKGQQVDYVLGEWNEDENSKLTERLDLSIKIIQSFALAGLNNTMNEFNGK